MRFFLWRSRRAPGPPDRQRVLIVSASIGGGHDGVAAEVRRRLVDVGIDATTVDFLDLLPVGIGRLGRRAYEFSLRSAPGAYEGVYGFWLTCGWAWRPMVTVTTLLSRRRLAQVVRAADPSMVVSVYPLASLALGQMRARGWLAVPVATYLTDFSAHPLWIHPGVDVHLGISEAALDAARQGGARSTRLVAPLVGPQFAIDRDRAALRAAHGFGTGDRVVLIVSGSWGVGAIVEVVETIGSFDGFRLVCVCGRNERLGRELEAQGIATVVGWTDQMASIMGASDVLVENAGGLTCMEALQTGLPVVTFDPIAGHGRHNAELMGAAGVVTYARTRDDLRDSLVALTDHAATHERNASFVMGDADATAHIRAVMRPRPPGSVAVRGPVAVRPLVGSIGALVVAYVCATAVFASAAAHGVGVDATGGDTHLPTVVGIRLEAAQLDDPAVRQALADGRVTAVLDESNACAAGRIDGIALASTGQGGTHRLSFIAAHEDISEAATDIHRCTGITPHWFVALRPPTAFDWVLARRTPGGTILDPAVVSTDTRLDHLSPHRLYLVDGTGATAEVAADTVHRIAAAEAAHQIVGLGAGP